MPHSVLLRANSLYRGGLAFAAVLGVAALLLSVTDQAGAQAALVAALVGALVALAVSHSTGGIRTTLDAPALPAEERRLRGGFRRQHRPDTPGRPMPRAPGSVI